MNTLNAGRAMKNAAANAYPAPLGSGLTKRELFAAMAMQGILARSGGHTDQTLAAIALQSADALLMALGSESMSVNS